jgi:[acyl-carrier-protein] S-malonyltransferase
MERAANQMAEALREVSFLAGEFPVYSNVTARPGGDWPDLLERQLKSPVRWTETVRNMAADGFDTFIECGHGSVVSGLIKRTLPKATTLSVGDPGAARAAIEATKERRA